MTPKSDTGRRSQKYLVALNPADDIARLRRDAGFIEIEVRRFETRLAKGREVRLDSLAPQHDDRHPEPVFRLGLGEG